MQNKEITLEMEGEELTAWKNHPSTQKVFKFLKEMLQWNKDSLARGSTYNRLSMEQTALATSEVLGRISGMETLMNLQVEFKEDDDLKEWKDDYTSGASCAY